MEKVLIEFNRLRDELIENHLDQLEECSRVGQSIIKNMVDFAAFNEIAETKVEVGLKGDTFFTHISWSLNERIVELETAGDDDEWYLYSPMVAGFISNPYLKKDGVVNTEMINELVKYLKKEL